MKKFTYFQVVLLIFCLVALTACSGDTNDRDDDNYSQTKPTDEGDTGNNQAEPTNGGEIVVGIQQDLDSLDPHKAVAAGTTEVLFNVFEGLVKPDSTGNLIPAVANSYEISSDGKQYTFVLRDGIKFHNGEVVTVEDIVYSVKRSAGLLDTVDPSIVIESALLNISEVNAVDEKTVEIKLKEGDTELLPYLTLAIIPKEYDQADTKPMGTGPFRFVSYQPLQSLVVEKFEEYWGDAAYLDKVTFKIVANTNSAFLELQGGTIDIYPYLTSDQAESLKDTLRIEEGNMNLVQGLFLNNKKAPFDNQKVREALNYAIDKQGILDMVAAGSGDIIGSNMFSGFTKYYVEELKNYYSYDVEKAKELLKEAGYDGTLSFTITVPSNYQYHVDTAQVISEQLALAGIKANIQTVEWSAWLDDVYSKRNYEATIIGLDSNLAARNLMERYASTASNNFVNYQNAEYDKELAAAIGAIDETQKIESYKKLQRILTETSASIYLQDPPLLVAVNKKLGGYTFYPVYVQDMAQVYFTK